MIKARREEASTNDIIQPRKYVPRWRSPRDSAMEEPTNPRIPAYVSTAFRQAALSLTVMTAVVSLSLAGATPVLAGPGPTDGAAPASAAAATYSPSSVAVPNPERGFYHHRTRCDRDPFDVATLTRYRTTEHITLVMCVFYLENLQTAPISANLLAFFDKQAEAVRNAGLKMIVRFAYFEDESGEDAAVDQVLAHIDQLAPQLKKHAPVIDVVQSGFVGRWGEGYTTTHFGNNGNVNATDWANRKKVVNKLLSVLPITRMVQVRTPVMKRTMFGTTPVSGVNAYGGSALSRVGHHNDCFLASSTDAGTYQDRNVEYPYLQADTTYVAMGGETCRHNPPRSACPTALTELGELHFSYLNRDYRPEVLASWAEGGCLAEVEMRLGYRLSLASSLFPATVDRGSTFLAQIQVRNSGWSALHNPRPVWLVLRNTATGAKIRVRLTGDPRRWAAGTTTDIAQQVGVPSTLAPGTYELLLSLPDPTPTLESRPEYAVQLANTGTWEPSTGLNRLLTTITVR